MSVDKFAVPGSLLTLDLLLLSSINWSYWFLVSKFATPGEVGQATAVNSFAFLVSTIALLGLEYTLVKKSSLDPSRILGVALLIQLSFILISIPILFHLIDLLYEGSLNQLSWLAVGLVLFSSLRYTIRFALLGISDARSILIINSIGAILQVAIGCVLAFMGLGSFAILISFLINVMFVTCSTFVIARRSFGLSLSDLGYIKEILVDALINAPAAYSKTVVNYLCVILLAFFGIGQTDVGIFYIALMVSFIVGSFASNMALMVIPASLIGKRDLSIDSTRIGLFMTAPLIATLILEPKSVLSLFGSAYMAADLTLMVLSAAIFPHVVVTNTISSFNNKSKPKQIVVIGLLQVFAFLISFLFLVPQYGIFGAGTSILVSSFVSFIPAIIWSERAIVHMIFRCFLSLASGLVAGFVILWLAIVTISPIMIILISVSVTLVVGFGLKTTTVHEIVMVVRKAAGFKNVNL
jgi:O-antigen/teichoic acid export membrane protein